MANEKLQERPHSCPYCEAEIAEASFPYCEACGLKAVSCPKCGISVAPDTAKCPNCGEPIKDSQKES